MLTFLNSFNTIQKHCSGTFKFLDNNGCDSSTISIGNHFLCLSSIYAIA